MDLWQRNYGFGKRSLPHRSFPKQVRPFGKRTPGFTSTGLIDGFILTDVYCMYWLRKMECTKVKIQQSVGLTVDLINKMCPHGLTCASNGEIEDTWKMKVPFLKAFFIKRRQKHQSSSPIYIYFITHSHLETTNKSPSLNTL